MADHPDHPRDGAHDGDPPPRPEHGPEHGPDAPELHELDELSEWEGPEEEPAADEPSPPASSPDPSAGSAESSVNVPVTADSGRATPGFAESKSEADLAPELPPEPLSPDQRRRARVLWALVLGLTALSFLWQHLPAAAPDPLPPGEMDTAPDATPERPTEPDPQFMLTSRMSVAMGQLGEVLPAFEPPETRQRRLDELRQITDDEPIDRLRLAIVAGELTGTESALRELDRVDVREAPELAADVEALRAIYRALLEQIEDEPSPAAAHNLPIEYDPGLDTEQRQYLIERHGWFGRLALSHRQPLADEQRARVLSEARQVLWTLSGFMLLAGFGLIVGTVLLIVAIAMRWRGALVPAYRREPQANLPLLETMAVFLGLMLVGGALVAGVHWLTGLSPAPLLYLALAAVLLWPLARGMDWAALRKAMGWHRGESLHVEAGWSLVGYVAGMPIIALGFLGTLLLASFANTQATHPAVESLGAGGLGAVLMILLLAVVWAPVVEESLFRGALYHHLRSAWGPVASALCTGLLFAVVHPQGWTAVPALTAVGVVLAMIREWRGSLVGPICVHAFHNLMVLTLAFMLLR